MGKNKLISILMVLFLIAFALPVLAAKPYISGRGDKNISTLYAHHEVHGGRMYSSAWANTLSSGDKILLLINTPAGTRLSNVIISIRTSGEANLRIWEDTVVNPVGGALQETQHNRSSTNVAGTIITNTPTVTTIGTELTGLAMHIGSGQNRGGEDRALNEIVLAPASLYLINTTSEANSNDVSITITWYESDDSY